MVVFGTFVNTRMGTLMQGLRGTLQILTNRKIKEMTNPEDMKVDDPEEVTNPKDNDNMEDEENDNNINTSSNPLSVQAYFQIKFVNMGQGDCCMIQCPDREVVMVDCGSKMADKGDGINEFEQACIEIRNWAKIAPSKKIHSIILTHPDIDHFNKLPRILNSYIINEKIFPEIKAKNLFFSCANLGTNENDFPLAYYGKNKEPIGYYIYSGQLKIKNLNEININPNGSFYRKWESDENCNYSYQTLPNTQDIDKKRFFVHAGKLPTGEEWSVSIIAGNVSQKDYQQIKEFATEDNTHSLITLLEINGKRALLCGDATFSTEQFLIEKHKELITDLDLIQIPHHGSHNASSQKFIDLCNPIRAVVSVGFIESTHCLPKYSVISRWLENMEKKDKDKTIKSDGYILDYWYCEEGQEKFDHDNFTNDYKNLENKGYDSFQYNRSAYKRIQGKKKLEIDSHKISFFYPLVNTTSDNSHKNWWMESGDKAWKYDGKVCYKYYREISKSNSPLSMTSQGTQTYYLSPEGVSYNKVPSARRMLHKFKRLKHKEQRQNLKQSAKIDPKKRFERKLKKSTERRKQTLQRKQQKTATS